MIAIPGYPADPVKMSAFTTGTTVADTDFLLYLYYTGGQYYNRKITMTNLKTVLQPSLSLLKGTLTDTYLCKYTASGTLLDCNVDPAGFQTADADLSTYANITPSTDIQAFLAAANNAAALTSLNSWGVSGSITDEQLVCSETTGGTNLLKSCGAKTTYTEPAGTNEFLVRTGAGTTGGSGLIKGTMTNGYLCTYTTSGTLLSCNTDPASLGGGSGDLKADGTVAMTAALVPNAANTIALGSTSAEWADIYLGDGAIIYGQNDQSNTITSSATGWSFAKPITIADVSNDNYIKITNNSDGRAPTASVYEIYPDAGVWKVNQNGTESSVPIGPTAGQVTFSGPTQARTVTLPDAAVTIPANPIGGTLGATTNVIPKASGTGTATLQASGITEDGTNVSIGALNLATTGTISGGSLTPVIDDPDNFASNFAGANLYGGTFIANAAGTAALPAVAAGMNFTIVLEGANAVVLNPDGTGTADTIYMNGLAAASDENITSSTSGAICYFQYRAANTWMATCNGFAEATPP